MRSRVVLLAAVVGAVALGSVGAWAAFTGMTTTPQPIDVAKFSSIPTGTSVIPSWHIDDLSSGGGGGTTTIYPPAFADDLSIKTSNASATFAANRSFDVDFASYAPAGQTAVSVTASLDFSDDNGDAKTSCVYMEARRASTGAVVGTFGDATTPLACQPLATPLTVDQNLGITSTDVANDLRLRLFFRDDGNNAVLIHRVVIKVVVLGKTWNLLPTKTDDALDTTPTGPVPWPIALVDQAAYRNTNNFAATYSAARYISLDFPDSVPNGAVVQNAEFENVWKTASAGLHCMIIEVYDAGTLIGTHGTTGSPAMCTTSSTVWSTDKVALPEVNTAARADRLTIRMYVWGGNKIDLDRTAIRLTWNLGTFDCIDPSVRTIVASGDSWVDQNSPTSTGGATDQDLRVETLEGARNRRAYLFFPLPPLPQGCRGTSATLKLFQNSVQGSGERVLDVLRASAPWTESALTWNLAPAPTGTAVSAQSAVANNATVTWDVTELVRTLYHDGNFGFVLRDQTEDNSKAFEQRFDSREGPTPPQLLISIGD